MIVEFLHVFATIMIGLYAGSLLTEATILVPYWRRMDPAEFFKLHGTLGPKLFQFYAPLTSIAVGAAILSGVFGNTWQMAAGGLCATALVIFFLYFKKANQAFAEHSFANEALDSKLSDWARWHWLRTVIVIGAFAASAIGLQ